MENMKKLIRRSKLRHCLLLVSVVSLYSLFFSPSSYVLHYFNLYCSSFASQVFSHTIDKNSMFLLCNGLLVFLGISRSFSKPDDHRHHDDHRPRVHDDYDEPLKRCAGFEDSSEVDQVKELKVEIDAELEEEEEEGKESAVLLGSDLNAEPEEEEEWLENKDEIFVEENVEEENWGLSTEQMNKKFEDFIRRMKEDLRVEAKRQIVMVYSN